MNCSAMFANTTVVNNIEGKRRQVPVMAHAHGAEGIRLAAEAGCRSIEHASFIDASGIDACLKNDTWIVPTFMIGAHFDENGSETGHQDRLIQLQKDSNDRYLKCIQDAVKAGVKVALGSDYVGWDPLTTTKEFQYLVERGGMSPMQAIRTGTSSAADLLQNSLIGRVKAGNMADLVVVTGGDPAVDISILVNNVGLVMKEGKIVKNTFV